MRHRLFIDQRAYVIGGFQRITYFQLAVCFGQTAFYFFKYGFVHDQAACRSAPLAGRSYGTENDRRYRDFQVCRGSHDDRIVPAEFEQAFSQPPGHGLSYRASHRDAARSRYQCDPRVLREPFAHIAAAGNNARDAFRYIVIC